MADNSLRGDNAVGGLLKVGRGILSDVLTVLVVTKRDCRHPHCPYFGFVRTVTDPLLTAPRSVVMNLPTSEGIIPQAEM
jgi:hypothetical protein